MRNTFPVINSYQLGLAASVLILTQAATAAEEVRITPAERQITLRDNGIFTLRFEVENRSNDTQELQESIDVPAGWKVLNDKGSFLLSADNRDIRLVHVVAPRGTASGDYQVHYEITATDNGSINSRQSVSVRIEEQLGTTISALQYPGSLLTGENYQVDYLVENTGNKSTTYSFSADDDEGYITSVEPKTLTIEPGKTGSVSVKGRVTRQVKNTKSYQLHLQARGEGKQATESISIPIIARTPMGLGKYQRLPGEVTGRYVQQYREDKNGATKSAQSQLEYNARGAIDKEGKHRVDIKLRTSKEGGDSTTFNQQSEYHLKYTNPDWETKAGHQSFYATALLGNSLNGLGVQAKYEPRNDKGKKGFSIKAFHGKSRASDPKQEKVAAALLKYQFKNYTLSSSLLSHKKTENSQTTDEILASVAAKWKSNGMTASIEVAKDSKASAYSTEFSGQWGKLGANASYLQAQPGFTGGYADTAIAYSNVSYRITDKTRLTANLRFTRGNIDNDSDREQRQDRESTTNISRTFGDNDNIEVSLGYRQRKELDLRETSTTDRTIHASTLKYRQRFEEFDVIAALEQGVRDDRINTSSSGMKKSLAVNWRPNNDIDVGASYAESDNLDSDGKQRSAGLNLSYKPNNRSEFSTSVQLNDDTFQNSHSNNVDTRYDYEFNNHHRLGVRARSSNSQARNGAIVNDKSIYFEYTMPLNAPLRRRDNIGSLRGNIRLAKDNKPAKNIVVQMEGQYAVTDDKGEFHYPDVVARDYQLQIDNTRPNAQGLILKNTSGKHTNTVTVNKGSVNDVQLNLIAGAKLTGRLISFANDTQSAINGDTQKLVEDKGISMALLELHPIGGKDKRIIHKRTTLFDGSFSFLGIPSGQWQLIIKDSKRLPSNSRLEQRQFLLNLNEGDEEHLIIRALPTAETIEKTGPSGGFDLTG